MRFRLLGPLEVRRGAELLPIGGARQRAVLAALLLRANKPMGTADLIEAVWERPPASARSNLRTYLAALRTVLRDDRGDRLGGGPSGYRLVVRDGELDLTEFGELVETAAAAAAAGRAAEAHGWYERAQALWRGDPLAGQATGQWLQAELARLDERRQEVAERAIDCRLDLGQHQELIVEIRERVAAYPYREGLRGQLILALHRSGRRAEALATYHDIRRLLITELGVEPGAPLRSLQAAVLRGQESGSAPVESATPAVWSPLRRLPDLVGRAADVRRLDELSRTAGLITISGPAGVGKTALVVHWARLAAASHPDGQIFLDLQGFHGAEPVDSAAAIRVLLRSLGRPAEAIPPDAAEQVRLLRTLTAGKRLLIVLDDARSADQVRPLLPDVAGCLVVVTSRERLAGLVASDGARTLVLEPLDADSALALLAGVLDDHRVEAEPVAAAAVVKLCAGLPLALRIVAARLATQPGQSIGAEIARLEADGRLGGLQIPGDPALAVGTAFDQSYLALDLALRRLFRLAGNLPGTDFSVPVAAATMALPLGEAGALLDVLCSASLVDPQPAGRYRFHDLLRRHAVEKSAEDELPRERRAALERALNWYLHSADAAGRTIDPHRRRSFALDRPDPALVLAGPADRDAALAWFETERVNLVAAVRLAAEQGLYRLGAQLPVVLFGFFELRRYWPDWISTHQIGLTCARTVGLTTVESWLLNSLGIAFKQLARFDEAFEHYREALRIRRSSGDRQAEAATLNNLGTASNQVRRFDDAADYFRQALEIFRDVGDRWGEGLALTNLGEVHRRQGRLTNALQCYQEATAIRQAAGDLRGVGYILHNIGTAHRALGRTAEAIEHFRSSLAVRRSAGDRWGVARTLDELGQAYGATGDAVRAEDCLRQALVIFDELGDPQADEIRERLPAAGHVIGTASGL